MTSNNDMRQSKEELSFFKESILGKNSHKKRKKWLNSWLMKNFKIKGQPVKERDTDKNKIR